MFPYLTRFWYPGLTCITCGQVGSDPVFSPQSIRDSRIPWDDRVPLVTIILYHVLIYIYIIIYYYILLYIYSICFDHCTHGIFLNTLGNLERYFDETTRCVCRVLRVLSVLQGQQHKLQFCLALSFRKPRYTKWTGLLMHTANMDGWRLRLELE